MGLSQLSVATLAYLTYPCRETKLGGIQPSAFIRSFAFVVCISRAFVFLPRRRDDASGEQQ